MFSNWGLGAVLRAPESSQKVNDDPDLEDDMDMPGSWSNPTSRKAKVETTPTVGVIEEEVDDTPAAFPALNSIQRSGGRADANTSASDSANSQKPAPLIQILNPDAKLMPPPPSLPPRFGFTVSGPSSSTLSPLLKPSSTLGAPSSSSATLSPLATTSVPANVNTKSKARAKVALTPGHSPLDWARLKTSGEDLRCGFTELMPITLSDVAGHKSRNDAWSVFGGKVYNITPYLSFHPGGEKELMRVAGRDGTKLFALTHSWVNLDYMLDGCMIGFLVPENN